MTTPIFKSKKEIIDYAFNGNDPWILSLVRQKLQEKHLNVGEVNSFIKTELKSFQDNYDDWLDKEHG